MKHSRFFSFTIVMVAYATAILAGFYSLSLFKDVLPVWQLLLADIIATIIVFLFSLTFSNSSIYDPFWSVIPPFIAWFWIAQSSGEVNEIRQGIVFILILLWAARLTLNWARGWAGLKHEDWRYKELAQKTDKMYWLVSFLGIHLFPTLLVFAGCLPLRYILHEAAPLNFTDAIAITVILAAIVVETMADEQLRTHKKKYPGTLMQNGVWAYSRHPNYFGEISFWIGIFIFTFGTESNDAWTGVGFVVMILLFVGVSIPMMEKRMISKRKGYDAYARRVSMLIPLPKKNK